MSIHKVNIDAIQEGVDAFLESFPHAPAERRPPHGVHAVLWVDDFWRGVDMAGEALEAARLQVSRGPLYPQPSMENLRRTACAAAAYSLDNDGRGLDYQVALCSLDHALDPDSTDINVDAVDVFVEQIASIYATGDADEPGHEEHYDLELHADREEPV